MGKLVALSRVAAATAAAAALLFLAAVPATADKPPPPPTAHIADADGDKIFDDLESLISPAAADKAFPAIVLLNEPVDAGSLGDLHGRVGFFDVSSQYSTINGFAASLTKGQIVALSRMGNVAQIEADSPVEVFLDTSTYWYGVQNGRTDFGVDGNADGQPTYSTSDMVIAVLDTGIDAAHVDLNGGKVVGWADFHTAGTGDPVCSSPCDPHGHGTHVSSIAAGEGEGNALYEGVAPGAALVGVRVLNKYGSGSFSGIIAGLQWVIDNKDTYGIRIINMSLGSYGCSNGTDSLSQMVNDVVAAGIVAVVSAGNSGPAACTIASPGAAEDAITVAAMADVGETGFNLAYFSSRGPTYDGRIKPDIAGPGRYIMAAAGGSANGYTSKSGTSMSSPFVAGVAALMLDADPALTPSQVKSTLMNTAVDWGPAGKDTDYGAGRLDGYAAIRTAAGGSGTNITVPYHRLVQGTLAAAGQAGDSSGHVVIVTDATQPIAITLVMPTWSSGGNVDFDMVLRDRDGVQVAISAGWTRQETVGISSPANGPYTFKVYAYSGSSSGPYFFDISVGGAIDSDGDGVPDDQDNCPAISNPGQTNTDGDGMGDACDPDDDNDSQSDADEIACGSDPLDNASLSPDKDSDGVPDCVDPDADGNLLKGSAPDVYIMDNGQKRHAVSKEVFLACGYSWGAILTVPDSVLNSIPTGPPLDGSYCPSPTFTDNTLLKGSAPDVYVMENGQKRHAVSAGVFLSCGYQWGNVNRIGDSTLNAVPDGPPLSACVPSGTLLRGSAPDVFIVQKGLKRHLVSLENFLARGFSGSHVLYVSDSFLNSIPTGQPLLDALAGGNLLKSTAPDVYVIEAGQKRHAVSREVFLGCGYYWDAIFTVPDSLMNSKPTGPPLDGSSCPKLTFTDGTLVKGTASAVWVMEGGQKRHAVSAEMFLSCGYQWGNINTIPDSVLDSISDGPILTGQPCP